MSYLSLINLLNFLINCLHISMEYGISIKRTGGLTSKKHGGIIKSMFLWLFSLFRKSLHTLFINLDEKLAARNFLGISKKWYLHSYWR